METELPSVHETITAEIGGQAQGAWPLTSWTLLRQASGKDADGAALATLAKRYERPILAYFGALTRNRDEARELAQGFWLNKLLAGPLLGKAALGHTRLEGADREQLRFRVYLKVAARNYWQDSMRTKTAECRDPAKEVSFDATLNPDGLPFDAPLPETPEAAYDRAWVRQLILEAMRIVYEHCRDTGLATHWTLFEKFYLPSAEKPTGEVSNLGWAALGEPFALKEKPARELARTVLVNFKKTLRRLVYEETGLDISTDAELIELLTSWKG